MIDRRGGIVHSASGQQNIPIRPPWSVVGVLSVTQIISWGSLFYAISVLIAPIEGELGWSREQIVGAFSLSLLCAGAGAVPVGILIDRHGGRGVMGCGSVAGAALLALLSQVHTLPAFYLVWIGLGCAMATLLYDPAFAVITASFGGQARKAITTLTFAGGFASSVFWPLTQWLIATLGWRDALLALACLNLVVCAPLHWRFLPKAAKFRAMTAAGGAGPAEPDAPGLRSILTTRLFLMLAIAFTANMLAFSALSVHLIPLLHERGYSMTDAVWLAALIGPMQVAGRVVEYTFGARLRASRVALVALIMLPVALVILRHAGTHWLPVVAFIALYGASNGIMTIARGALPAELYGRARYGAINGMLSAPVLASRALGPLAASFIWAAGGYDAVVLALIGVSLLGVVSFLAAIGKSKGSHLKNI